MGFLKLIGAVSAAEHEREIETLEDLLDETRAAEKLIDERFKKAINDLAEYADDFKELKVEYDALWVKYSDAMKEIAALRPDAEKWRDRAARELQRGQAKRDAKVKTLPVTKFHLPTPPNKPVAAKGRGK